MNPCYPRGLVAHDLRSGQEIWRFGTAGNPRPESIHLVNLDGISGPELVFGTGASNNVREANGMNDGKAWVVALNAEGEEIWKRSVGWGRRFPTWVEVLHRPDGRSVVLSASRSSTPSSWYGDRKIPPDTLYLWDGASGDPLHHLEWGTRITGLVADPPSHCVVCTADHQLRRLRLSDEGHLFIAHETAVGDSGNVFASMDINCDGDREFIAVVARGDGIALAVWDQELELQAFTHFPGSRDVDVHLRYLGCSEGQVLLVLDRTRMRRWLSYGQNPKYSESARILWKVSLLPLWVRIGINAVLWISALLALYGLGRLAIKYLWPLVSPPYPRDIRVMYEDLGPLLRHGSLAPSNSLNSLVTHLSGLDSEEPNLVIWQEVERESAYALEDVKELDNFLRWQKHPELRSIPRDLWKRIRSTRDALHTKLMRVNRASPNPAKIAR